MPKKIDTAGLKHFKDKENAMVASEFSASKSYAIGEYVYYKGTLYKFKAAHAAGAWTNADVDAVKLADDVSVLKESISGNLIPLQFTWENGTINASGENALDARLYYARTNGFYIPANDEKIIATFNNAEDATFIIVEYNNDNSFSKRLLFHSAIPLEKQQMSFIVLKSDKKYRFGINEPSTITIDLQNITNYIGILRVSPIRKKMFVTDADIISLYNTFVNAYENYNVDVHIQKGTYVFTNELIEQIVNNSKRGIPIGHGCHYYFEEGAIIDCTYTGANENVKNLFSPFDSQSIGGDYEIHNLYLIAKNVVYGIHDESNGSPFYYKRLYKGCVIIFDNSALGELSNPISKCIGGGLGQYCEIEILDSIFSGINPAKTSAFIFEVSYHGANNSTFTNAKIIMKDSYFVNGSFAGNQLAGNTETPTPLILFNGNSFNNSLGISDRWTVYNWNNVIRST